MGMTLTLDQLRTIHGAGGVRGVTLRAEGGSFYVEIETMQGESGTLAKARSTQPREFGNPSQALSLLHRLGLAAGAFDLRGWNPALKAGSRSRPDRAEALRRTHEAASHDAWFRAQVEEALREADDPDTAWMAHEDVTADMAMQRARIMEMMAGKPGKGR